MQDHPAPVPKPTPPTPPPAVDFASFLFGGSAETEPELPEGAVAHTAVIRKLGDAMVAAEEMAACRRSRPGRQPHRYLRAAHDFMGEVEGAPPCSGLLLFERQFGGKDLRKALADADESGRRAIMQGVLDSLLVDQVGISQDALLRAMQCEFRDCAKTQGLYDRLIRLRLAADAQIVETIRASQILRNPARATLSAKTVNLAQQQVNIDHMQKMPQASHKNGSG